MQTRKSANEKQNSLTVSMNGNTERLAATFLSDKNDPALLLGRKSSRAGDHGRISCILPMALKPSRKQEDVLDDEAAHGHFPLGATKESVKVMMYYYTSHRYRTVFMFVLCP